MKEPLAIRFCLVLLLGAFPPGLLARGATGGIESAPVLTRLALLPGSPEDSPEEGSPRESKEPISPSSGESYLESLARKAKEAKAARVKERKERASGRPRREADGGRSAGRTESFFKDLRKRSRDQVPLDSGADWSDAGGSGKRARHGGSEAPDRELIALTSTISTTAHDLAHILDRHGPASAHADAPGNFGADYASAGAIEALLGWVLTTPPVTGAVPGAGAPGAGHGDGLVLLYHAPAIGVYHDLRTGKSFPADYLRVVLEWREAAGKGGWFVGTAYPVGHRATGR